MRVVSFQALDAEVRGYIQDDHDRLVAHKVRPALIVCPGGAYPVAYTPLTLPTISSV